MQPGTAGGAAGAHRRKPHRAAGCAAAHGCRYFRLSRLRHGAADGGVAAAQPRPDRNPRRGPNAPHNRGRVRQRERRDHRGHAGAPGKEHHCRGGLHAGERAPRGDPRRARCAVGACPARFPGGTAHGVAVLQYYARRIRTHGECRQGVHRGRRHFPGGAVATLRGAIRIATVRALPGAATGQSSALSLFPPLWRLLDRRLKPGNPGAGTRPRGTTLQQDRALESELLADEKERAEHLMLLDLGRNDVGRVARTATVKVTDQFSVERFSQVMHIVSNVEGQLDGKYDALDALAAGFPAGTVSGAPKVRAMEIIDELEPDKRGLYAGSVGYFSAAGELDSCIVLRTALIKDGMMYVQAGAGIVADSNPKFEQQECVDKAKALFRAAEEAKRFANAARRGQ